MKLLSAQCAFDALPTAADFLHRFLDSSFGFSGFLCLIPNFVILAARNTSPILFATSTGLFFCHLALLVSVQRATNAGVPLSAVRGRNEWDASALITVPLRAAGRM